jgi:hypothetical protein
MTEFDLENHIQIQFNQILKFKLNPNYLNQIQI